MRITILLTAFFTCFNLYACADFLKSYPLECKSSDRYQDFVTSFEEYSVNITKLKGYLIPKAIGKDLYYANKNDLLNNSQKTLKQIKQWQIYNNGQKYINSLSLNFIDIGDITKLHKSLFTGDTFLGGVFSEYGKLRTNSGVTNPKIIVTCNDALLNKSAISILENYDLTSSEGYPLINLEHLMQCPLIELSSGEIIFYKGASIKTELNRWSVEFNDLLSRYENSTHLTLSPYRYLSDMKRWFLAIKPFPNGNEEVINALIDYALVRLKLPPLLGNLTVNPVLMTASQFQQKTIEKAQENLSFFENCLFETKTKLISLECLAL